MEFSINYKGISLECFSAGNNAEAKKFAMGRYSNFDTCDNIDTGEVVCTKALSADAKMKWVKQPGRGNWKSSCGIYSITGRGEMFTLRRVRDKEVYPFFKVAVAKAAAEKLRRS